ncbi:type VII secretion-associated serine protease mycosin [Streptomyces sp. NPDC057271]|uniref:type VII secretion-associated serine protease mycosin n=1 Tax=unclassified Streptomyces TaxID=2593676 RepID=UPI00363296B8
MAERRGNRKPLTPAVVCALTVLCLPVAVTATPMVAAAAPAPVRCAERATATMPDLPWAQARLELERVHRISQGEGQVVAVVDSGVDASVPQLKGAVLRGTDVVGESGRGDTDCVGHGTFVAGIVAARPAGGVQFAGVAPRSVVLPVRQTTDGKDGSANGMAAAIRSAVDGGAGVINISANAAGPSAQLKGAVAYAVSKNVLIVASVGNRSRDDLADPPASFPASYPGVLGVGAIGRDDRPASFSVTGDFVDVAAPGVDVISLGIGGPGYAIDQGTSFAAPFVSGTAALIRAYHPDLTVSQIIHRLHVTADRPAGAKVPGPAVGWGVINPFKAVTAVIPEERAAGEGGGETGTTAAIQPSPSASGNTSAGGHPQGDAAARSEAANATLWFIVGTSIVVVLFSLGILAARRSARKD